MLDAEILHVKFVNEEEEARTSSFLLLFQLTISCHRLKWKWVAAPNILKLIKYRFRDLLGA